ncbi:MAG TPA: SDR family NAD(P)-dependent oxidoreductase [Tepidiformaceae bacterium]|nr:SDR family NAD(P)-dependent oxidoreductase [Tepidiformaceae bacterium]
MQISGKAAVVSGGASGIGKATATELASRGARVVVADMDEAQGMAVVEAIKAAGGDAVFQRCDVTKTGDLAATFAGCQSAFGRFDIAFNNAGIAGEDIFEPDGTNWQRVLDIDLRAVMDATRQEVMLMRESGGGVIVNTASMGALVPMPDSPTYATAKAGVVHFTRSLAGLQAQWNIRVNAICPTFTDTPLVRRSGDERLEELKAMVGGILQPEDVAAGVVELIEDDSRAGAIMRVTVRGGRDYARDLRP